MISKRQIGALAVGLTVAVGAAVVFACLAVDVGQGRLSWGDQAGMDWAVGCRAAWLNVVFIIITYLVHPVTLAGLGLALLFFAKQHRRDALWLLLNVALTALLNVGLKQCFRRARPDITHLVTENGYSFPSGHAMAAVATYGFLIYLVWQTDWRAVWRWLLTVAGVVVIGAVGLSRVYLGVHYVSDILAGYSVAMLMLMAVLTLRAYGRRLANKSASKEHHFLAGFGYALTGIWRALQTEFNFMVQCACALLAIIFGICLQIAVWEWCVVLILCFLVLSLELVNTALENLCDKITTERDPTIKYIKDVSAGAVLLLSVCALISAILIFLPKLFFLP